MIRKIIIIAVVIVFAIVGISFYLQPNDLASCNKTPIGSGKCQSVDAIVAVSGGDTMARARQAIELYNNGWSKVIIFSGAAQDKTGPSNAAAMKAFAEKKGVPTAAIYIDEYSETTQQNAAKTQAILTKLGVKKIILVTSGYHQRRASLEFNKLNHGVIILNHPVQSDKDWSFWWWTTIHGWWLSIGELVKIAVFHVEGIWS